jgi:hypothetical protein
MDTYENVCTHQYNAYLKRKKIWFCSFFVFLVHFVLFLLLQKLNDAMNYSSSNSSTNYNKKQKQQQCINIVVPYYQICIDHV